MHVGKRIRQLREQRGWSQEALAIQARRFISPERARSGAQLARETISRIENGHRAPDAWVQEAIASALGVSVADLLRETEAEQPGQDEAVLGGRAELAPEIEELAGRLDGLPSEVRDGAVELLESLVQLLEQASATVSERARVLIEMFEQMNPEDQATLERAAAELRTGGRAASDASGDVQQAS